jgi:uncharacterized iron-regulated protein
MKKFIGRLLGKSFFSAIVGSAVLLINCGGQVDSAQTTNAAKYDFSVILENITNNTIIATYAEMATKADALVTAAKNLLAEQTSGNIEAAKNAWVAARAPWELSEAFLFGPVADLGLDPSLDSWPVDNTQMNSVLASGLKLTFASDEELEQIMAALGNGVRGFHTIEYLIWGPGGGASPKTTWTERELQYLLCVTTALKNDALLLLEAWDSSGDIKFGEEFYKSGQSGGRYYTQLDAIVQLVNGMIDICDEVANGKLADPYDEKNVTLVESRFSYNSLADFQDNIRSVRNIYLGSTDGSQASGITTFIAEQSTAVDEMIKSEINAALAAIQAIKQPFENSITDPGQAANIEAAQNAIRTLMNTFSEDVMNLLR